MFQLTNYGFAYFVRTTKTDLSQKTGHRFKVYSTFNKFQVLRLKFFDIFEASLHRNILTQFRVPRQRISAMAEIIWSCKKTN